MDVQDGNISNEAAALADILKWSADIPDWQRVVTVGLDIGKDGFQAHGANTDGVTVFNRHLPRSGQLDREQAAARA